MPPTAEDIRRLHGQRIAAARTARGLNQRDLAARLTGDGIPTSPQSVSMWENGITSPSPARQVALAGVLGCPWRDLFDLDNVEPPDNEGAAA